MNILVFAGSNSSQSINKALATHAADVFKAEYKPEANIEILDLNDYEMPIYSMDREQANGIPELAQQFFSKIGSADALIVSFAEHNGFYSAAWKNIFDWMSRIEMQVFQNKPMLVLATSPGAGGAGNVLKTMIESAPFFAADIKGSLSVPVFQEKFDREQGILTHEESAQSLRLEVAKLVYYPFQG